jgi:transcriptional regulator with XRE-family HTH domain
MEPVERRTLGYRLRQQRDSYGLTQNEVALAVGMSPSAITQFERNKLTPTKSTLEALARFYHVAVPYLLHGTKTPDQVEPRTPEEVEALALLRRAPPKMHRALLNVMRVQIESLTSARR